MSGTNASIPLAYNPQPLGPDLGRAIQVGNQFANFQANAQALRGQNAMRALFADPSNLDASGMPNANAMRQIMAVDPDAGMKLMANKQALYNQQLGAKMAALNIGDKQQNMLREVNSDAMLAYDRAVKEGKSPEQARAAAQDVYTEGYDGLTQSGAFSPDQIAHLSPQFDPDRARLSKGYWDAQKAGFTQQLDVAKLTEQHRHNVMMETKGSPAIEAAQDVNTIAAGQISDREKQLGRPLTDVEKATIRESVRAQVKAGQGASGGGADTLSAQPGQPIPTDVHGEEFLKALKPDIQPQVKALAEGRMAFPSSFALRTPYWQSMLDAVSRYDPSFDAVNYNARSATRTDFTKGKMAQNITSFNTAIGHLGELSKVADKLSNSWSPTWNTIANFLETEKGDPRASNFNIVKAAVADELTRAFRGTGGNVSDIKEWEKSINSSSSPEQLEGAVREAVDLLQSRIDAVGEQYKRGMGTTADVTDLLTPHAKSTLDQLEGKKNANPPKSQLTPEQAEPLPADRQAGGVYKDVTAAEYGVLPKGAHYTKPGSDKVFVKQ